MTAAQENQWIPLEADPDMLTSFIHRAGVTKDYQIVDVLGLDDELLAMLPQPVKAFILLFPITEKYNEHQKAEAEELAKSGAMPPEDLFFLKQNVSNACGTIALIHAVANTGIHFTPDGILQNLINECQGKTMEEKGDVLASLGSLVTAHQETAAAGLTTVDMKVMNHFIALVEHKGTLYELDGRKTAPIAHGPVEPEGFVKASARVCKEFMARDPDEMNFNIMALTGV